MNGERYMQLKVLLPTKVLVDTRITKVVAEAANGAFCLLPRHIDFVAALVPGLVAYVDVQGQEHLLGIDTGTLVKCGQQVLVSTLNAVEGEDLEQLRETVEARFLELDEEERRARSALARFEAGTLRRFRELQETRRG
jgi:F-type H+-transporting ATPase subunit epsilon